MPPTAAAATNASVHQGKAAKLLAGALSDEIRGVAGFSMVPDDPAPSPGVALVLLLDEVAELVVASELLPSVGVLFDVGLMRPMEVLGVGVAKAAGAAGVAGVAGGVGGTGPAGGGVTGAALTVSVPLT